MNQFLSNKITAGIVALALLVGVGVLISSGDTSSTTRNAALVVATPCTKPGQVTKVSKQSVVCAALSPKNIWYPVFQEKKWICAKLGITRKQNGIFSVCGKNKSSKKRWFLTKPLMANSNPGLPTTDQEAFVKLTTNPELIVETSPTTPLALAATTETTLAATTETTLAATTETTLAATTETTLAPTTETTLAPTTETTLAARTTPTTTTPTAIPKTYQVGETGPGGGKVFYDAGTTQSWGRYLEAAPTDYQVNGSRASVVWGCIGTSTGATATAIGTGRANTATILTKCTTAGIAADVANKYSTSTAGAGQWFLPSRDELRLMYDNRDAIGGFSASYYWSSSEDSANQAWFSNFYAGWDDTGYPKSLTNTKVRPVRAFSTTALTTTALTTTVPTAIPKTYQVGETGPGGGKVFYDAGTTQSWGRYLEAAPTDYQVNGSRASVVWGCIGTSTGATATAIGTGRANTATILTKCTTPGIAADVANKYSTSTAGAGQWFLPSRDELRLMYVTRVAIGGFSASYYWSSSEDRANHAWFSNFYAGWDDTIYHKSLTGTVVRPVRAF